MLNHAEILCSQYRAALEMLKQAVVRCPPELWDDAQDRNRFWHVAYHALFYTHLYLHPRGEVFQPWPLHRVDYEFLGPKPWPPHELPTIGEPYTPGEVLAFLEVCQAFAAQQTAALDLEGPSGFSWLPFNKLELQIYNIRHLQQHTGELMERLGSRAQINVDWKAESRE